MCDCRGWPSDGLSGSARNDRERGHPVHMTVAVTLATPGQNATGMAADLSHARAEGVAHFYEGTDTLYGTLPAFFAQEVIAVAGA